MNVALVLLFLGLCLCLCGSRHRIAAWLVRQQRLVLKRHLPRRIYIIRHGESIGNVDEKAYAKVPDNKIELTERGKQQASVAGQRLFKSMMRAKVQQRV